MPLFRRWAGAGAIGNPIASVHASGLKALGGAGLFVTGFVTAVSLIAQNVGTLPQAVIVSGAPSAISSTYSLATSREAQVLGAEPFGTSQVMLGMNNFTSPDAADRLGAIYGMQLAGAYPAFGRYLFNLPQIRVDSGTAPDTALVTFPPRTTPAQVTSYLASNQLRVTRWYRSRDVLGEIPSRGRLQVGRRKRYPGRQLRSRHWRAAHQGAGGRTSNLRHHQVAVHAKSCRLSRCDLTRGAGHTAAASST